MSTPVKGVPRFNPTDGQSQMVNLCLISVKVVSWFLRNSGLPLGAVRLKM